MDATRELERRPGVLAVSIFQTQPWMDLPEVGWSVEVVTDDQPELGRQTADELAPDARGTPATISSSTRRSID